MIHSRIQIVRRSSFAGVLNVQASSYPRPLSQRTLAIVGDHMFKPRRQTCACRPRPTSVPASVSLPNAQGYSHLVARGDERHREEGDRRARIARRELPPVIVRERHVLQEQGERAEMSPSFFRTPRGARGLSAVRTWCVVCSFVWCRPKLRVCLGARLRAARKAAGEVLASGDIARRWWGDERVVEECSWTLRWLSGW